MITTPDQLTPTRDTARPAAGRPPVAPPAAGYVGTLLALLLLAVGAVALRDFAVDMGWLRGSPWSTAAVDWLDGLTYQDWMRAVGVVVALAGLWSLYAALRPRRRTAIAVPARSSVWIGPTDLARLAAAAAETVPGVLSVRASANLRTITVKAEVTAASDPAIRTAITSAVGDAVSGYTTATRIKVRTRTGALT
ncbi:DUF6286 domain-containing protein [Mycolicibacterium sp.]|uniref:DUF6286 domain-containing protein n=1 Tax=Mycolicibacterium sp. TaxID=2320850 RepID=UPI001A1DE256|nr:DUF6286 domain-containing protein [Mycolicibacterium sp.]MBJ7339805.1 hypothetical protein [Mycolicibacterium sp.]